jgi:hypothetical protein
LLAALRRANAELLRTERSRFGPILESWVFGELLKLVSLTQEQWFLSHYRDKDQIEVDFVLESPLRAILGIEVKAAATVTATDFKGLRRLRDLCGKAFVSGIVLLIAAVTTILRQQRQAEQELEQSTDRLRRELVRLRQAQWLQQQGWYTCLLRQILEVPIDLQSRPEPQLLDAHIGAGDVEFLAEADALVDFAQRRAEQVGEIRDCFLGLGRV